jgi:nitroreductase
MIIPSSRWYEAIRKRRSRRRFDESHSIELETLGALRLACAEFRPFPSARSCLVTESADRVFRGVVGSYGKVKGARAFVAFVGDLDDPSVQEKVGYTGEGIILEATALGLSTCWVAGFFDRNIASSLVQLHGRERILAVSPLGYAPESQSVEEKSLTGFGLTHRRSAFTKLVTGLGQAQLPEWIKSSIEAARLAPSAVNRQPWGFEAAKDSITVFVRIAGPDFNVSKRLDCGIAMLHVELTALARGIKGQWQFLEAPQVARFTAL